MSKTKKLDTFSIASIEYEIKKCADDDVLLRTPNLKSENRSIKNPLDSIKSQADSEAIEELNKITKLFDEKNFYDSPTLCSNLATFSNLNNNEANTSGGGGVGGSGCGGVGEPTSLKNKLKKYVTVRNTAMISSSTANSEESSSSSGKIAAKNESNASKYFSMSASAGQKFKQILKKYV